MEINPTVWRKWINQVIQKWWLLYVGKSTLKLFGFRKTSSEISDRKMLLTNDEYIFQITGEKKIYIPKEGSWERSNVEFS